MTIQEIVAEIERLEKAATPGPWCIGYCHIMSVPLLDLHDKEDGNEIAYEVVNVPRVAGDTATPQGDKDGNLIVALRNHAPALIVYIRKLEKEKKELKEEVECWEANGAALD